MKNRLLSLVLLSAFLTTFLLPAPPASAESIRLITTVVIASNEGSDFNLDNGLHRDKLLQLFSYSAYKQVDQFVVSPEKGKRYASPLPGDYELILTLQNETEERVSFQAVIRKGRTLFLDTVLLVAKPGIVFVGGPQVNGGDLILILEAGY